MPLSDEDGTANLGSTRNPCRKSSSGSTESAHFREGDKFEVKVAQLDNCEEFNDYLEKLGKKVGLVKMDIEGAEEKALRGMEKMLREHKPAIMHGTCSTAILYGFISSKQAVTSYLESLGYELVKEFEWNGLFLPKK